MRNKVGISLLFLLSLLSASAQVKVSAYPLTTNPAAGDLLLLARSGTTNYSMRWDVAMGLATNWSGVLGTAARSNASAFQAAGNYVAQGDTNALWQSGTNAAKGYADATMVPQSATNGLWQSGTNAAKGYTDSQVATRQVAGSYVAQADTNAMWQAGTNAAKVYTDTQTNTRQPTNANLTTWAGITPFTSTNYVANVKTFGAQGNGVTDDTTAIQTALSNSVVYFPAGNYIVTSKLTTTNCTVIFGDGPRASIIQARVEDYVLDTYAQSNTVQISGLGFVGTNAVDMATQAAAPSANSGIKFYCKYSGFVDNCRFQDLGSNAVWFGSADDDYSTRDNNSRISGSVFTNCWRGIQSISTSTGAEYVRIERNRMSNMRTCIDIYNANITVQNNSLLDSYVGVALTGVNVSGSVYRSHATIQNNEINHIANACFAPSRCGTGFTFSGNKLYTAGSIYVTTITNGVIEGNFMDVVTINGNGSQKDCTFANNYSLSTFTWNAAVPKTNWFIYENTRSNGVYFVDNNVTRTNANSVNTGTNFAAYFSGDGSLLTGIVSTTSTNLTDFNFNTLTVSNNIRYTYVDLYPDNNGTNFVVNLNNSAYRLICTNAGGIKLEFTTNRLASPQGLDTVINIYANGTNRPFTCNSSWIGLGASTNTGVTITNYMRFAISCDGAAETNVWFGYATK